MKLISHGAAREVTGSCHELQIGDKRILLDCGLFQGRRKLAVEKNSSFAFDPPKDIHAVVLSHAHMDHVGRIPLLWKRGFRGAVHCTYASADLAAVMLADGGYIQEKDEEYFCKHFPKTMLVCDGPLYTQRDARACAKLFQGKNYESWFDVAPGVRAQFLDAGHILGAAMVVLEVDENVARLEKKFQIPNSKFQTNLKSQKNPKSKVQSPTIRIGFSGDLGRSALPIIRDPAPMPAVDILICESTYGNRSHEDLATAKHHLRDTVVATAKRGGKVLIPAFSLERTQEIVYDLHLLWDEKMIPPVPIFIDSPLASRVTGIFLKHPECYNRAMYDRFLARGHNPFQFSLVKYTESVEESKALNGLPGPAIIMAGSGMCEAGRIRHHLRNGLEDPRNTVVAVGYMAENTLGRRIIEPSIRSVRIFDEEYSKKAEVVVINAYSGHADKNDLDQFIAQVVRAGKEAGRPLRTLFLVHGEGEVMKI
ncbi:MAG: MBL fold metallo-hydrolase, partial [Patescibacteria group bacterium]